MNARRESNHDGDDTNGSAFSSTSSYSILPSSRQLKTPTLNENNNNNNTINKQTTTTTTMTKNNTGHRARQAARGNKGPGAQDQTGRARGVRQAAKRRTGARPVGGAAEDDAAGRAGEGAAGTVPGRAGEEAQRGRARGRAGEERRAGRAPGGGCAAAGAGAGACGGGDRGRAARDRKVQERPRVASAAGARSRRGRRKDQRGPRQRGRQPQGRAARARGREEEGARGDRCRVYEPGLGGVGAAFRPRQALRGRGGPVGTGSWGVRRARGHEGGGAGAGQVAGNALPRARDLALGALEEGERLHDDGCRGLERQARLFRYRASGRPV